MNYLYESLDKPTRLYIKQCPHCGLKYFGKTIREDIDQYHGSGLVWKRHLKKYKVDPIHLWNSNWYYDSSIKRFAQKFSIINKIVESSNWANLTEEDGLGGGDPGPLGRKKISDTQNSLEWQNKIGNDSRKRQGESLKNTMNNKEWKETIGELRRKKIIEAHNDIEWKNTVKKDANQKMIETLNDPTWKSTIGLERSRKASKKQKETLNDPTWKSTVGENKRMMSSIVQNDPEWKAKKYKTCEHCGKGPMHPSNYVRHHSKNCKHTQTQKEMT